MLILLTSFDARFSRISLASRCSRSFSRNSLRSRSRSRSHSFSRWRSSSRSFSRSFSFWMDEDSCDEWISRSLRLLSMAGDVCDDGGEFVEGLDCCCCCCCYGKNFIILEETSKVVTTNLIQFIWVQIRVPRRSVAGTIVFDWRAYLFFAQ